MIETKWLTHNELDVLEHVIKERGWTPLNKANAIAVAKFEDGKLLSFIVLRQMPLVGPFWVDTEHRGSGLSHETVGEMATFLIDNNVGSYMTVADSPFSEKLCEFHGMEKIASPVYLKKA